MGAPCGSPRSTCRNIDRARAAAARKEFHEVIWAAAKANRANAAYQTQTIPWAALPRTRSSSAS